MFDNIIYDVSDPDEDTLRYLQKINRKKRFVRHRPDHFAKWNDYEFSKRFRMSKATVSYITKQIEHEISSPTNRNEALSPSMMVMLTLRFYATGSFLITIGDFFGVHKSTANKVIHMVSHAIAKLRPRYVKFPTEKQEIQAVREEFCYIAQFPCCIGAIGYTHVKIEPSGHSAETYINTKQFYSIKIQIICGANLNFFDIVARWPGSSQDLTIFNNSTIRRRFENGEFQDSVIVGDSGNSIRTFLITPLANPQTDVEKLFNKSQIRTQNSVERCYVEWKRRFPILALGLRLKLENVEAVIIATAVLHNIACDMHDEVPPIDNNVEEKINFVNDMPADNENIADINDNTRLKLINEYFAQL